MLSKILMLLNKIWNILTLKFRFLAFFKYFLVYSIMKSAFILKIFFFYYIKII